MDGSDPGLMAMAGARVLELTHALMQAAQSASQAAQAAATVHVVQGQQGQEGGVTAGGLKRDLANRPNSFNPLDREQEVLLWRDWYWGFKQYLWWWMEPTRTR